MIPNSHQPKTRSFWKGQWPIDGVFRYLMSRCFPPKERCIGTKFQNYLPKLEVNELSPRISFALQDFLIEQQLYLLLSVKSSLESTIHIHKRDGSGLPVSMHYTWPRIATRKCCHWLAFTHQSMLHFGGQLLHTASLDATQRNSRNLLQVVKYE